MKGFMIPVQGGDIAGAAQAEFLPVPDIALALPDTTDNGTKRTSQENSVEVHGLAGLVRERFTRAELGRRPDEQRWMEAYRNYRGLYGSDQVFTETERSKIFVKVTKTKVFAMYGQLCDIFFANNQFPISVEPEKLPEGQSPDWNIETDQNAAQSSDMVAEGEDQAGAPLGFPGDGQDLEAGATIVSRIQNFIGKMRPNEKLANTPASSPTSIDINPFDRAAKEVQKKIMDQLKFSDADKHLRLAAFENVLFGTCIVKGPLAANREIPDWDTDGNYSPKRVTYPQINAVSVWNFYPDPDAYNGPDCQYMIERHSLSRSGLLALKRKPFFRNAEIDACLTAGYNYESKWWEKAIRDVPSVATAERYEALEYWGTIDTMSARSHGVEKLPEIYDPSAEIPVNIWVCNGRVIRCVFNPFNPKRNPYFIVPHELQPYKVFGIGVAENMSDSQMLMNGFMRMAVDNATISGNCIFEIDESQLVPGQDFALYPGKMFRKQGAGGQKAIESFEIPNTAQSNLMLFDKARELADEATFPSYMHGQTGVNPSLGRTSSGMSMMMGASSVVVRNVVKNFDDYLFVPMGEAMYAFNRQFNPGDKTMAVNIVIKAGGTDSLMRNEVKSQKLAGLMQVCLNPAIMPFVKVPQMLREQFKALDLDPDTLTNTAPEAFRQAMYMKQLMEQSGMMQQGGQQPMPPGSEDSATGRMATPGEKGFSAAKEPAQPAQGKMNGS